MSRRLTPKQQLFVSWYCSSEVGMNGTEAARRAGYRGSDTTLANVASENLRKPYVREKIDECIAKTSKTIHLSTEKVLRDIEHSRLLALHSGKFGVAVRCSELQGKYLKMWSERIEHIQNLEEISNEQLSQLIGQIGKSMDGSVKDLFRSVFN